MAMLAEPRRRQRIGQNPRGKFFAEQDNNFGKTLLQKMGWSSGEGLGMERQGISEAIKPKIQMSSKGLGFDPKANPWVEHNQEFEEILKGLNAESVTRLDVKVEENLDEDESSARKLENKSKKSRARIHYHKFVKGKDLSRASSEDMKSIFGNTNPDERACFAHGDTQEGLAQKSRSAVLGNETKLTSKDDGENLVNKGSMVDYFKQKMALKLQAASSMKEDTTEKIGKEKKKRKRHQIETVEGEGALTEAGTEGGSVENFGSNNAEPETKVTSTEEDEGEKFISRGSMLDYFKQKMALKAQVAITVKKEKTEETVITVKKQETEDTAITVKKEKTEDTAITVKKEKTEDTVKEKKRRRRDQIEPAVEENKEEQEGDKVQMNLLISTRKEKKKRKRDRAEAETVEDENLKEEDPVTIQMDSIVVDTIKKKRKRRLEEAALVDESLTIQSDLDSSADILKVKRKRKRDRDQAAETVEEKMEDQEHPLPADDSSLESKKRKKKKTKELEGKMSEGGDEAKPIESEPPVVEPSPELSLEEQLKLEMENLKNGKQRMKQQYFSSLGTVSKKFIKKGANIDQVKGYVVY